MMNPVEIEVMNDRVVIVQLEPGASVEAARLLHGMHNLFGQVARISLLCMQQSIQGIVADREEGRTRMAELERDQKGVQEEQERVRQEQVAHVAQLERVLTQFGHEVQKVEELQKNAMAAATPFAQLVTASQLTISIAGACASTKVSKTPCPSAVFWGRSCN